MKLSEFQTLAKAMGASVVYQYSAGALFRGLKYTVAFEMTPEQLETAKPVEVAYTMSGFQIYN